MSLARITRVNIFPTMKTLLAVVTLALAASVQASPQLGKPAPDFSLNDLSGKNHDLSDLKGKFVVLEWVDFGLSVCSQTLRF